MLRNLLCLLLGACFVPAARAADSPESANIIRDIEFAKPDGHSLKLDFYLPEDRSKPVPIVIFIHGGGWKNGSRKSGEKTAAWLTDHGFAVASIDYRLTDVAQWPAQIDDCYAAVKWLFPAATNTNWTVSTLACGEHRRAGIWLLCWEQGFLMIQ